MSSLTGLSPNNPRDYVGPNVALNTVVTRNRAPTGADYRQPETGKLYPFNTFWLVGKNPTTGIQGDLWYLSKIVSNIAYWIQLNAASALSLSVQVQAATAPGVNPVLPTAGGLYTINGAAVANHSVPIETRTRALNTFNIEAQYAASSTTTDGTKSGLAHFDSASFDVDANGFVQITGLKPNSIIILSDDFIGSSPNSTLNQMNGSLSWYTAGLDWLQTSALGDSGHPGVISNIALPAASMPLFLNRNASGIAQQIILGGGVITINFVLNIVALSVANPRYILRFGFGDTENADQANGVYFEYSDNINSGKWVYKTAAASVRTTSNSSTAVGTGYHNFQIIINAVANSINFAIDGISLGPAITTNIPTLSITPFIDLKHSVGTVAETSIKVDLIYLSQILTTTR
jgi:hypothetical protein